MPKKQTFPELTDEEAETVRAYAEANGAEWKARLRSAWMRSAEPGILQRLRNTHGPSWLAQYSPKGETQ
ncbi:MAG TPA: hypothetical protein VFG22_13275 [Polyangiales bacterium]|nr:hypothetical protein [Polyangiales bacterium]